MYSCALLEFHFFHQKANMNPEKCVCIVFCIYSCYLKEPRRVSKYSLLGKWERAHLLSIRVHLSPGSSCGLLAYASSCRYYNFPHICG